MLYSVVQQSESAICIHISLLFWISFQFRAPRSTEYFPVYMVASHVLSISCVCVCTQSCPAVCDPVGCSPLDAPVHGILQARILGWVAISYSRGSSQPRDWTHISCVSCIDRWILYHWHHLGIVSIEYVCQSQSPNSSSHPPPPTPSFILCF